MSSKCPNDDSSEAISCLLRVIEQNTKPDYNWDPITFAFTAAIGILALVIAAVTVFQQLLAAGPGRLKASNLAIGPFSIHSRSRFDRTEIALRTTARVPLITWDVVFHRIVRQKFKPSFDNLRRQHHGRRPSTAGQASDDNAYNGLTTLGTTSVNERHQFDSTATWLTLLTALGLDDPTFFPLVQRVTDYLPADVQAAPAAAELRCLAILAAIADDHAVIQAAGPSSRFVTVSADSSQLSFREHPSLGYVGAYDAYAETAMLKVGDSPPLRFGTAYLMLKFEDLDRCLQLASGRLAYANGRLPQSLDSQADERGFLTLINDLAKRSAGCSHDICANAAEDWALSIGGLEQRKKAWHLLKGLKSVYMAASLLAGERSNICRAFPRKKLDLDEAFATIIGLDDFWSNDFSWPKIMQMQHISCLTFWNPRWVPFGDTVSASWVVDFKDVQSTVSNPFSGNPKPRQEFSPDRAMYLVQHIRAFITKQTNPDDPGIDEIGYGSVPPQSLAQLFTCVDEWLLRDGGGEASCSMLQLLYQVGMQARLLTVERHLVDNTDAFMDELNSENVNGSFRRPNGTTHKPSIDDVKSMGKHSLEGVKMSTLLVFRGILMVLLLNQGADTSSLYQPEFRDSVVKIL